MLAITYTNITKIKVAKWGAPKKYKRKKQKKHWLASACRYLPMYHDDFANAYNTYICLPYLLKLTNVC
jgi:hypothetical protein